MKFIEKIKKIEMFYVWLIIYVVWLISLKNRQTGGMDDFDIFFKAGERLNNGENIYGPPHWYNLKYFYSVLFAGIMSLFQGVNINTVKLFWFILNTSLFIRVFFIIKQYVLQDYKYSSSVFFFLLLISGKMVLVNYTFNQISVLILWTMLEAFHQMVKGRIWPALLLLCIGINIKIMPVVLAPYFLFITKKPGEVFGLGIGFILLFLFIPIVWLGWDYNAFLIGEWWKTLNPVSEIHVMQTYEYGFTDISSLITKFFSSEAVYNEPQLHIADLSMRSLFLITNGIRVLFLALVVYMCFKLRKPLFGIDNRFVIAAAFMALIPLCFPHQREYSYMFAIPSLAITMTWIAKQKKWTDYLVFIVFVALSGMLVWIDFAGEKLFNVFRHYRLITMGMSGLFLQFIWMSLRIQNKNAKEL